MGKQVTYMRSVLRREVEVGIYRMGQKYFAVVYNNNTRINSVLHTHNCKSTGDYTVYGRNVKLIFTGGHISLMVAFKGPNIISTP